MKQIALSLFVIASSGAYVWDQAGKPPANDLIDTEAPANTAAQGTSQPFVPSTPVDPVAAPATPLRKVPHNVQREPAPQRSVADNTATIAAAPKLTVAASPPQVSRLPPPPQERNLAPAAASVAMPDAPPFAGMNLAAHGYADGVYTGPPADAYYGIIQLQALVQGGRLTALKILKYPNDRRTSVSINRQALPMLRDEAISAQSADVDIISGATLTSRAFIQSLGGALKKASS